MRRLEQNFAAWFGAVVMAGMLLWPVAVRAQGVTVALLPSPLQVAPGSDFELDLVVTQEGAAFNGFDAYIGFDPAALTFVPLAPTILQEGSLITNACGNTFHIFSAGATSLAITDVLLCSDTFLTGPGQLYKLKFHASNTPQITTVKFNPGLQFYDAGLYVNPAFSTDALVGIGMDPVGVGPGDVGVGLSLRLSPNPATAGTTLTIDSDRAGDRHVRLTDVRGRIVRRFDNPAAAAGIGTVAWDGRDAAGRPAPAGVYVVTVEQGGRVASKRLALVR